MRPCIICCDWGTTAFRVKVLDVVSRQICYEESSREGVASMFNNWKAVQEISFVSLQEYYLSWLSERLALIAKHAGIALTQATVLISGMAGSSIGMVELPYAAIPFGLNGRGAVVKRIQNDRMATDIYLISGVSDGKDVMRGEETQLAGLSAMHPALFEKDAICILPGTHSKHVHIQKAEMVSFKTYMTGELFSVLNEHSILKPTNAVHVDLSALSTDDWVSFTEGVQQSRLENLLNSLFTIRARKVLNGESDRNGFFFLSGLLIGNELAMLIPSDMDIILCSTGNVYALYEHALAILGLSAQTKCVSPSQMENAYWEGQLKIIDHIIKSENPDEKNVLLG